MAKPNLFTYATSELSQDAMICWLLAWADTNNSGNMQMYHVGVAFLNSLFEKFTEVQAPPVYWKIEIKKQYKGIDVLCIVNDEFVLLIEDKTGTKNHSRQLSRYMEIVKKDFQSKNILPIYFKTQDQGMYNEVLSKGYRLYLRKDFLKIFPKKCMNHMLIDYREYLQTIEDEVNSYQETVYDKWGWGAVKGFFMRLQQELNEGNWDYVPNPSGGFYGFWWHTHKLNKYKIYLQIDAIRSNKKTMLVLKIKLASGTKEKIDIDVLQFWKKHILKENESLNIKKPKVVRRGRWTTIGIVEDFLVLNLVDKKIDISKTVEKIHHIEHVFKSKILKRNI
jgi:hypothetical protein